MGWLFSHKDKTADSPAAELLTALEQATNRLDESFESWQKSVDKCRDNLKKSYKAYQDSLKVSQLAFNRAWTPKKIAGNITLNVKLFENEIVIKGKSYPITADINAIVDTAGNISRTRRWTATRAALIGVFSVFAPKATKHDDRQLFLLIEAPTWSELVELSPKLQRETRELAQAINLAGRNIDQARADRRSRIEKAKDDLKHALDNISAIEVAKSQLQSEDDKNRTIVAGLAQELEDIFNMCKDQKERTVKRAGQLLAKTQESLSVGLVISEISPKLSSIKEKAELSLTKDIDDNEPPVIEDLTTQSQSDTQSQSEETDQPDIIEQIKRLDVLRQEGVITQEQFEAKRAELLNRL